MDAATSFWATPIGWTLATIGGILLVTVGILISLAFLLLADRKIWAGVQLRKGPNVVGPFGLLQSFADFFKFVLKEIVVPAGSDKVVFLLAPLITFVLAFIAWAVIPFAPGWVISDLNVGILYILAISSLGVYGIIMGGWASNSKYPFLGSLRSAAQMVSYEVSMGLIIINVILLTGTMNLTEIVTQQAGFFWNWHVFGGGAGTWPTIIVMIPMTIVFFISALAETNRPPFDLPEAESELVAGYQVEYSSTPYLLFMIGEYANIVFMCAMMTLLFCGGWNPGFLSEDFMASLPAFAAYTIYLLTFIVKVVFWFFMIALVKAFVPRYRYDQLMRLGWKIFLPASLVAVVFVAAWRVFAVGG
ncbi:MULTISPECIES: NADH-quinone oxidoreductase subunit NuoH [unclassified Brevundimonas]|uniref:NADH-quinone oxidoreductase subunit NuoH n=1 Tax=unclassified Brevundimonas TaxID=2622653 RepID=UPI0025C68172|nr:MULTISPECIES: NADH-quinone oxidoreductase subunit NuoH [unclassified Brevundimonas]